MIRHIDPDIKREILLKLFKSIVTSKPIYEKRPSGLFFCLNGFVCRKSPILNGMIIIRDRAFVFSREFAVQAVLYRWKPEAASMHEIIGTVKIDADSSAYYTRG
ncbi:MAG: hypothetical protein Q4B70_16255, partial [Lachnospiraceae bacterium]|nr:hypothetical protein [Lachnospiraceae bacterium]